MTRRLRLLATVVAAAGLLAASFGTASAKPAPGSTGTWYVYYADSGCTSADSGCVVVVTKQALWKGSPTIITCSKVNSYPDYQCDGSGVYYIRLAIGDPWKIYSNDYSNR